jgi:tellurite resistance-related uncharacterized protein
MIRVIEGFHPDEDGEWVAELSCLHGQHVRHQPPIRDRPWVTTAEGREGRIGMSIECLLCDRAELPDGLVVARKAGPFDERSLPAGLRADHRVAEHTWGRLRVLEGQAGFELSTDPPIDRTVFPGEEQPIPPGVAHRVVVTGHVRLEVDFLARRVGSAT